MPVKSLFCLSCFIFCTLFHGNASHEWVQPGPDHYLIPVGETGLYKISFNSLRDAGFPVETDPVHFRMFAAGREVPLHIVQQDTNAFSKGDFLLFRGEKNDGRSDSLLFEKPAWQPHKFRSIYSDTAMYFLTFDKDHPGKRYRPADTAEHFHDATCLKKITGKYFTEHYHDGTRPAPKLRMSTFTEGEGWIGKPLRNSENMQFPMKLNACELTTSSAEVEIGMVGVSASSHHVQVSVRYPDGNFQALEKVTLSGFQNKTIHVRLPDDLMKQTEIAFKISNVSPGSGTPSVIAPAYTSLRYFSEATISGNQSDTFILQPSPETTLVRFTPSIAEPVQPVITDGKEVFLIPDRDLEGDFSVFVPPSAQKRTLYTHDLESAFEAHPVQVHHKESEIFKTEADYVIITHADLLKGANEIARFYDKKGLSTLVVDVEKIYDRFYFGISHPLAIRKYTKFLADNDQLPQYLLLAGKGIQADRARELHERNLVPVLGVPPSDILMFAGIDGEEFSLPFAVGRLPAVESQQLIDYADKLRSRKESPAVKNVLHLPAGSYGSLNETITDMLIQHEPMVENQPFGGNVITLSKLQSMPPGITLEEKLRQTFREGVVFTNYFGHGSANVLEIDLGAPDTWGNTGQYPVMFFNGCVVGNFYQSSSLGESYVFDPKGGAIGWFAGTSAGFTGYLHAYSMQLYEQLFSLNPGISIGKAIRKTISVFQQPSNAFNTMQVLQMNYLGCPAVNLIESPFPNFSVSGVWVDSKAEQVGNDELHIGISLENHGAAIQDSVYLRAKHVLPDGQTKLRSLKIPAPYFRDTLKLQFKGKKQTGEHLLKIAINPDSLIREYSQTKNDATYKFRVAGQYTLPLWPREYGISGSRKVLLIARAGDLFTEEQNWIFELDTTPRFNSPAIQRSGIKSCRGVCNWQVDLYPTDTQSYFWRSAILWEDNQTDTLWRESTFTFVSGVSGGWAQSHFAHLHEGKYFQMFPDMKNQKLRFQKKNSMVYEVIGSGAEAAPYDRRFYLGQNNPAYTSKWFGNGLALLGVDPANEERYLPASTFNHPSPDDPLHPWSRDEKPYSGVMFFDWIKDHAIDTAIMDSAIAYLNQIPSRFIVLGALGRNHQITDLPARFSDALDQLSLSAHRHIENDFPYVFIGDKTGRHVYEKTADTMPDAILPASQEITIQTSLEMPNDSGQLTSQAIGPARSWKQYSAHLQKIPEDSIWLSILALDTYGDTGAVISGGDPEWQDLAELKALDHPFIKIKKHFANTQTREPAQIINRMVIYEGFPKGVIDPSIAFAFHNDTLLQGEPLHVMMGYRNFSSYEMQEVPVRVIIEKVSTGEIVIEKDTNAGPLNAFSGLVFADTISTLQLNGKYTLKVHFFPDDTLLQQPFNNKFKKNFRVEASSFNLEFEAFADGVHLQDGIVITPSPEIKLRIAYKHPYVPFDDPDDLVLILLQQADTIFHSKQNRHFASTFLPAQDPNKQAEFTFMPQDLDPGLHTLEIRIRKPGGNHTEQINQQYTLRVLGNLHFTFQAEPNPSNGKIRFRYAFSGQSLPEDVKVHFYDVSGRHIHTFNREALGSLNAGNHTTRYVNLHKAKSGANTGILYYKVEILYENQWLSPEEGRSLRMY